MEPIEVTGSAATSQVMTATRTFCITLVAYGAGRGWIDEQVGMAGAGLFLVLVPAAWAQVASYLKQRRLVTIAERAPNSVAVVK